MVDRKLAFVTVVFEPELPLLHLQARSLARNLAADLAHELVVIDNTRRGMPEGTRSDVVRAYGPLSSRIRILRPSEIADVPISTGWRAQQALKLCIADLLDSDRYVVLDAKNHAIGALTRPFFEAPDGRPRVRAYDYHDHPLRSALEHVLRYLGVDPTPFVDRFTATVTPFVLDVPTVRAMMSDIASTTGRSFAREFVRQELTEFFLYTGWLVAQGSSLDEAFATDQPSCPTVWPPAADLAGVEAAVRRARETRSPWFAVHRQALARLDATAVRALVDFWTERAVVSSVDEGMSIVEAFKRDAERFARRQRVTAVPRRAATAIRRARRRIAAGTSARPPRAQR